MVKNFFVIFLVSTFLVAIKSSDITPIVFGNSLDGLPAAFGDFDSDELTDVFVLRDHGKTLVIMLAADTEPLLRPGKGLNCSFDHPVTSVVPGDFDGDAFMDVFVTTFHNRTTYGHLLWGGNGLLNCNDSNKTIMEMKGQPLAIDYNQDMIIDLFGQDENGTRTFWVFNNNRTAPTVIKMHGNSSDVRIPHSNAFLDLNDDFMPDLFITANKNFEIWLGSRDGFTYDSNIHLPCDKPCIVGQSLFLDVELTGKMDLVVPICYEDCKKNSSIMIYSDSAWHNLQVEFKDGDGMDWNFGLKSGALYIDTITLRGGDFNMDGYPDLLATLVTASEPLPRTFLLENEPCTNCKGFGRTFKIRWMALNPLNNRTVMAVFYDFYQDGILDVILVQQDAITDTYRTEAFKNSLDYDANFVKVMVLTGLTNSLYPITPGTLGRKKRTYGTNLPGPSISYKTTTQDGSTRMAVAAQLSQSAHFSLNLPYSTFGLGRTPNFVDTLTIGLSNRSREWTQIIPNSQMVVIPTPISEPSRWKAQLFVTPSKLILLSVAALTGTCILITAIIMGLYWKERREDKIEKLQEAHRFHFDAM